VIVFDSVLRLAAGNSRVEWDDPPRNARAALTGNFCTSFARSPKIAEH
jgi:hypothetical protein